MLIGPSHSLLHALGSPPTPPEPVRQAPAAVADSVAGPRASAAALQDQPPPVKNAAEVRAGAQDEDAERRHSRAEQDAPAKRRLDILV